jgi:uncharacterized protein YdeI (YjbR/CyaY-like superfamily)
MLPSRARRPQANRGVNLHRPSDIPSAVGGVGDDRHMPDDDAAQAPMMADGPRTTLPDDLPELLLPDAAAWHRWLEEHHTQTDGVWLVLTKKGGTTTALDYEAAVQEALCFGWIDGQGRKRDDQTSYQRMTPRRARSPWSALNVARVEALEREGRMHDAGRAQVEAAKADGRWARAYGGQTEAAVPEDLAAALAANADAQAWFDVLTSTNRLAVLYRIEDAKRPETRQRRIADFVEKLARGETPFPQKRRPD